MSKRAKETVDLLTDIKVGDTVRLTCHARRRIELMRGADMWCWLRSHHLLAAFPLTGKVIDISNRSTSYNSSAERCADVVWDNPRSTSFYFPVSALEVVNE